MLRSLTILTLAGAIWQPYVYHLNSIQFIETIELKKNEIQSSLLKIIKLIDQVIQENKTIQQDTVDNKNINNSNTHKYVVPIKDIFNNILSQYGINISNINQITVDNKKMHNLQSSQKLSRNSIISGNLQHLTWKKSRCEISTYNHKTNIFKISNKIQQSGLVNSVLKGTVDKSFISSARSAGLTSTEISTVIKVMQWQMDFRKLKKGDEFAVLMSHEILDSKREQSQLVGVHLHSANKDYYAIRAEDGKFYDRNGTNIANEFLRFPTSRQFPASSNFNLNRLNPVTGRMAPHYGVDFAMPQGTPVLAVGDGKVIAAKHSNAAGYYVTVRHGNTYTTRYMHLRKLLVRPGQKVKRGDRIALSGNTGRSTGPHLHYEIWINKQAVNPLTAKLPHTKGLAGKDRTEYLTQVKEVMPQLRFN